MRSLQSRLNTGLLISLLIAFVVLWLLVNHASRVLAEEYIATRLTHDAESLLTAIQSDAENHISLDNTRVNPVYTRPFSGHYYKIISDNINLRSRSLWDQDLALKSLAAGKEQRLHLPGPQQQHLLIIVSGYEKAGHAFTIAIAEDLSPVEHELTDLMQNFALAAILLLLMLIAIQGFILHTGLRPLDKTRRELQALTQGKLSQLDGNVPHEIAPLVTEINHLLGVLEKRLTRSRNALGDLAHSLKKPLTVLTQLSRDDTILSNAELQHQIEKQLGDIQQQLTHILQRARLAGEGPVSRQFNSGEEIPALVATLNQMYRDKNLQIESRYEPGLNIIADREDILELIGNLLDNACKWARHKVRLSIQKNQHVEIHIEDDGPGVAESDLDSLTQRGLRLDETNEGHGLGLAIVNDIVASLDGKLIFRRSSELGGLHAHIIL